MAKDFNPDLEHKSRIRRLCGRGKAEHEFYIDSFGVQIRIAASKLEAIEVLKDTLQSSLGGCFKVIDKTKTEFCFQYNWNRNGRDTVFKNGEKIAGNFPRKDILERFESQVRITIAEFAVEKVFIHAGVIGWKDKALIIPARSFRGKTALVAEFVKRGAAYYSDEYAILDADGCVHPFPKTLSLRGIIDQYKQVECPVEKLGGVAATKKIPVGMFLLTEYKEKARWKPKILSSGQGIMEILPHTVPVRHNPEFSLKVLNRAANRAIIAKSFRGDVSKFAEPILKFFETNVSFD